MIVVWIILVLLFIILIWLLLAPIRLNIDSSQNKYLINWGGLGKLALIPAQEEWFFNLRIGFWRKKFFVSSLVEKWKKKEKKKPDLKKKEKKKKSKKTSFSNSIKKARRVMKSFKVRVCKINLDTDDYYWNALLIPAFQLLNKGKEHRIAINFKNQNDILLSVENRLIKIIYSVLI